jgi:hypothetical protein
MQTQGRAAYVPRPNLDYFNRNVANLDHLNRNVGRDWGTVLRDGDRCKVSIDHILGGIRRSGGDRCDLDEAYSRSGRPDEIRIDRGFKFSSTVVTEWSKSHDVTVVWT